MKLKTLIDELEILEVYKGKELNINGISYHSQKIQKGHVFVCIKGYETDGHKFLLNAKDNGAIAAIVEHINENVNIPQYRVKNSRIALARMSSTYYNHPSKKLTMIGISATNGKTTTSYMTNAILENHNLTTGLLGTVDIKIGDKKIPSELTTPESLELQYYLDEMVNHNVSHATMEVSSAAKEMHRDETVDYDIVTLNNISTEHLDTHGSFERYFKVKSRLITNAKKGSFAILNLDCPYSRSLIHKTAAEAITFSLKHKNGHFYCSNLDLSTGRAKFKLEVLKPIKTRHETIEPQQFDVQLAVPGLHSVYNSMVAIIISLLENVSVETIQESLKLFKGVERRFEFIYEDEMMIIDDHFANPGNINVTLGTLDFMNYNNLHLVYAIRGNRGEIVNRDNAEIVASWASKLQIKEIIVTKSVSHVSKYDKVSEEEEKAFIDVMDKEGISVLLFEELPDAVIESIKRSNQGDLILLAGCQGMDCGAKIALDHIKEQAQVVPSSGQNN